MTTKNRTSNWRSFQKRARAHAAQLEKHAATTQLVAMAVLATALASDRRGLDEELARVPTEIECLLEQRSGVDAAVAALRSAEHVVVSFAPLYCFAAN